MNETLSFTSKEERRRFITNNPQKTRKCNICKRSLKLHQMLKGTRTTRQGKRWDIGHRCNECRQSGRKVGKIRPAPIQEGFASFAERAKWENQDTKLYECRQCEVRKRATEFAKISHTDSRTPYRFNTVCHPCKSQMEMDRRAKMTTTLRGAVSYRLISIRNRSSSLGLDNDLSADFVMELWDRQSGNCFYSGRKMEWTPSGTGFAGKWGFSIDRLDPRKGYIQGNVVLCLNHVNTMKSDLSVAEFRDLVYDIGRNRHDSLN